MRVTGTSALTARLLLRVVSARSGEPAVDRVLKRAGMESQDRRLRNGTGRISHADKLRLLEAAAAELSDPRVGLLLGPATIADPKLVWLRRLVRAAGSPSAAFRNIARLSAFFEKSVHLTSSEVHGDHAVLKWRHMPSARPTRFDCDYTASGLAQVPVLFGQPAARVSKLACQLDGAPECVYTIRWLIRPRRLTARKGSAPDTMALRDWVLAEHPLSTIESMMADLGSGVSMEATLDRIIAQANDVLPAPGHLMDIRLPGGETHTLSRGRTGAAILHVPVASRTRNYGSLAAVPAPGQEFSEADRSALEIFARHTAAGLDVALLVDENQRQRETAQMLLDVAKSFTERSTVEEVTQSIADATILVAGTSLAAVALWDAGAGQLRVVATSGWDEDLAELLRAEITTPAGSPELAQILADRRPRFVDRNGSAWSRAVLDKFRLDAFVAFPVLADDEVTGLVLVHWPDDTVPPGLDDVLRERLSGIAGLASVALEKTRLFSEAQHLARHDPLTGLPNRLTLEERLDTAIAAARHAGGSVGLLFCDVNRFKRINDSLGHSAGDEVLRLVAARLRSATRSTDTVARYSGDEFVVLLPDVPEAPELERLLQRLHAGLSEHFDIGGQRFFVEVAIGVGLSGPLAPDDQESTAALAQKLIDEADLDMYRSKRHGRRTILNTQRRGERLELETELHGAILGGQLRVHYQPQLRLSDAHVVGAEALVRWQHPQHGLLGPDAFIALAEESNLICDVGAFVLAEACRTGAGWRNQGRLIEMSVNLAPAQLADPGFVVMVQAVLAETGFPASALTLEITESKVLSETAGKVLSLSKLSSLGVGLSIDDFGTGYSSLSRLHRLPVTEIKIDRSFTARMDRASPGLAGAVIGLGKGLGLRVAAEGVETREQLDILTDLGCDRAQGYLVSKPVDALTFENTVWLSGTGSAGPGPR